MEMTADHEKMVWASNYSTMSKSKNRTWLNRATLPIFSIVIVGALACLHYSLTWKFSTLPRVTLEDTEELDSPEASASKHSNSAPSHDLAAMFDKIHSDPDVKPVKGAFKVLTAIQRLGNLPDLSFDPKRKKESAVVSVARFVPLIFDSRTCWTNAC